MKSKNLILPGSILILIIGIILVFEKPYSTWMSKKTTDAFLPGFSVATCSAFSIQDSSGSVKLRKENSKWLVSSLSNSENDTPFEEFRADSVVVQSALGKLDSIKLDVLISQNPEKRDIFEVDSAKGTKIEVWNAQNESLGVFFIGKSDSDWKSNFVRIHGSNNVYTVRGSIKFSFFTDENRWRDKTILNYDSELTQRISIAHKDSSEIILEKSVDTAGTATWNIIEPKKSKTQKDIVDKLVNNLASFFANDFEKDKSLDDKKMGFDNPSLKISIELENGDKKNLLFGNKNQDNKYWVRNNESEFNFLIYEGKMDNYNIPLSKLMEKKEK